MATLTTDELLIGGRATHTVALPDGVLSPALTPASKATEPDGEAATVVIRPLVLADVQRIHKAAGEQRALVSVLMVQQALVEPSLSIDQVNQMHAGLVQFLLAEVNRVSGLTIATDELNEAVQAPMARACFTLAREFGWTPDECAELTVGQVLLYLEMLGRGETWTVDG